MSFKPLMEVFVRPETPVRPGDILTCWLRVTSTELIHIDEWEASLVCEVMSNPVDSRDRLQDSRGRPVPPTLALANQINAVQQRCRTVVSFVNDGELDPIAFVPLRRNRSVTSVELMPIEIRVPSPTPDTWLGGSQLHSRVLGVGRSVRYKVKVEMSFTQLHEQSLVPVWWSKTLTEEVDVVVKNDVDARHFDSSGPGTFEVQRSVGILGIRRRPIVCNLTIASRGIVQGEMVYAEVNIQNNSLMAVKKVTLSLHQEVSFRNDGSMINNSGGYVENWTQEEMIAKVSLPRVRPGGHFNREVIGLTVPWVCLSTCSFEGCPFLFVNFFVRLRVKWHFGSMHSDVQVFVGTMRSGGIPRRPSDERLSQYVCRT